MTAAAMSWYPQSTDLRSHIFGPSPEQHTALSLPPRCAHLFRLLQTHHNRHHCHQPKPAPEQHTVSSTTPPPSSTQSSVSSSASSSTGPLADESVPVTHTTMTTSCNDDSPQPSFLLTPPPPPPSASAEEPGHLGNSEPHPSSCSSSSCCSSSAASATEVERIRHTTAQYQRDCIRRLKRSNHSHQTSSVGWAAGYSNGHSTKNSPPSSASSRPLSPSLRYSRKLSNTNPAEARISPSEGDRAASSSSRGGSPCSSTPSFTPGPPALDIGAARSLASSASTSSLLLPVSSGSSSEGELGWPNLDPGDTNKHSTPLLSLTIPLAPPPPPFEYPSHQFLTADDALLREETCSQRSFRSHRSGCSSSSRNGSGGSKAALGRSPHAAISATVLFFPLPLDKYITNTVRLDNLTKGHLMFRIKATAPQRYIVNPRRGILDQQGQETIRITSRPFSSSIRMDMAKDKFLIETRVLSNDELIRYKETSEFPAFANQSNHEATFAIKLVCRFCNQLPASLMLRTVSTASASQGKERGEEAITPVSTVTNDGVDSTRVSPVSGSVDNVFPLPFPGLVEDSLFPLFYVEGLDPHQQSADSKIESQQVDSSAATAAENSAQNVASPLENEVI